jgi:peptide/nickel transport system ATP-binding protein
VLLAALRFDVCRALLLPGEIPSPRDVPKGCGFHPRCRFADDICHRPPALTEIADGHLARCHFTAKVTGLATPREG